MPADQPAGLNKPLWAEVSGLLKLNSGMHPAELAHLGYPVEALQTALERAEGYGLVERVGYCEICAESRWSLTKKGR